MPNSKQNKTKETGYSDSLMKKETLTRMCKKLEIERSQETTLSTLSCISRQCTRRNLLITPQRSTFYKASLGVRATVWLVGFGPGDPDLLTIKGLKLLKSADIIFYDDLLNKDFLLKFKAEKVYVGKRKGKHSHEQEDINKLLYEAALAGKKVVRLKGGDPMLFAHGGEEIEYLRSRNINVDVVPGVTAALAAAAFANIPLTHRGISSSVTFTTGHSLKDLYIPASGTLVYYMGASNLHHIAKAVIEKGWKAETPVLLVYNASNPNQKEFYTTLQEVKDYPQAYDTPLIIMIGEVVRLRQIRFETQNLVNQTQNLNDPTQNLDKQTYI